MAKFEVGQRVRVVKRDSNNSTGFIEYDNEVGIIREVGEWDNRIYEVNGLKTNHYIGLFTDHELQLVEEPTYTITPKVGERYRVVKEMRYLTTIPVGEIIEFKDAIYTTESKCMNGTDNYCTTEYLELVEEPIKQTLIQKTMSTLRKLNAWQKRTFNADTQAQYRAGFINNDLTPTEAGIAEMQAIAFEKFNTELTARAKEIIDEVEAETK